MTITKFPMRATGTFILLCWLVMIVVHAVLWYEQRDNYYVLLFALDVLMAALTGWVRSYHR